jgi:hypothetical protein
MANRKARSLATALAVGVSAALVVAPASAAHADVPDFQIGIQLFDNRGRSGAGVEQFTRPAGTTEVVNDSPWAGDDNNFDPDGARINLLILPDTVLSGLDFRVGAQARDLSEPEDGRIRFSPWASEGRGDTGVVTDMNGNDPDQYRLFIETRPLPDGAAPITDFRLYIVATDTFEPDGRTQFTPFASEGGGRSRIALDLNGFDPDGFRIGLDPVRG